SRSRRADARAGRKPSNAKRSLGRPATDNAAIAAHGPGTGDTAKPASLAARTMRKPGSLTSGVPASEISATALPAPSHSSTRATCSASLCSCSATTRASLPACASNGALWRVSSAATTSTSRSTCSARGEKSPRLPIGVATTHRHPASGMALLAKEGGGERRDDRLSSQPSPAPARNGEEMRSRPHDAPPRPLAARAAALLLTVLLGACATLPAPVGDLSPSHSPRTERAETLYAQGDLHGAAAEYL